MRNWNENILPVFETDIAFLLYLWGIEMSQRQNQRHHQCQFLLYLWGIEIPRYQLRQAWPWGSFYFTYEELKFINLPNITSNEHRFYFTYEELKYESSFVKTIEDKMFLLYLWGIEIWEYLGMLKRRRSFYFTYEELKLRFIS